MFQPFCWRYKCVRFCNVFEMKHWENETYFTHKKPNVFRTLLWQRCRICMFLWSIPRTEKWNSPAHSRNINIRHRITSRVWSQRRISCFPCVWLLGKLQFSHTRQIGKIINFTHAKRSKIYCSIYVCVCQEWTLSF